MLLPVSAPCGVSAVWGFSLSGRHPKCLLPSPAPEPYSMHRKSPFGQHQHCKTNTSKTVHSNKDTAVGFVQEKQTNKRLCIDCTCWREPSNSSGSSYNVTRKKRTIHLSCFFLWFKCCYIHHGHSHAYITARAISTCNNVTKGINIDQLFMFSSQFLHQCVHYLQCTVMGWFPDCCCCFCTAAIMLIMPLPSVGMPTSGQPWKWNRRTARALFSWKRREAADIITCNYFLGYLGNIWCVMSVSLRPVLPCCWWPEGHALCSSHSPPPFLFQWRYPHRPLHHHWANTEHTFPKGHKRSAVN